MTLSDHAKLAVRIRGLREAIGLQRETAKCKGMEAELQELVADEKAMRKALEAKGHRFAICTRPGSDNDQSTVLGSEGGLERVHRLESRPGRFLGRH